MCVVFAFFLSLFYLFGHNHAACGIWVPWPGIKPAPPTVEAWHLNHWTTREVPVFALLIATESELVTELGIPGCFVLLYIQQKSWRGKQDLFSITWVLVNRTNIHLTNQPIICVCVCVCVLSCFSRVWLFATLMDCSPPGSSVHRDSLGKNTGMGYHALLQGIFPTQGSSPHRLHYRWILYHWATGEAQPITYLLLL